MRLPSFRVLPAALCAGLSGLVTTAVHAQTPFEGELTMRVRQGTDVHAFVREGKTRMEMSGPGGQQIVILMDPAAQEQYMIMPSQQMYMVMKLKDLTAMADAATKSDVPNASDVKVEKTGKTEEAAGRSCDVYRFTSEKGTMEVCIAEGLGALQGPASFWTGGGGMMGMMRGQSAETPAWAKELMRRGAFPLRIRESDGAVLWEVTKIEKKSLDAGLFSPPSGYRRMDMPGRPPAQ